MTRPIMSKGDFSMFDEKKNVSKVLDEAWIMGMSSEKELLVRRYLFNNRGVCYFFPK